MSDYIDRQAAIDRINIQRAHLRPEEDFRDAIGDAAYRICIEMIERLPSAEEGTHYGDLCGMAKCYSHNPGIAACYGCERAEGGEEHDRSIS